MHSFDAELLENIILYDVQRHAETAIKDEKHFLDRLFEFSGAVRDNKSAAHEKNCVTLQTV